MSVADFSPSRSGAIEGGADKTAIFLKLFSGEVLTAFEQENSMADCVITRTIKNSKSAQFPILGRTTASFHTPGVLLTGKSVLQNERIISLDNNMVSDISVAEIDELMASYEVRSPFSSEIGQALARTMNLYQTLTLIQAARTNRTMATGVATAGMVGITPPSAIYSANAATVEATLRGAIFSAAQALDLQFVPKFGRKIQLQPAQYYLLVNSGALTGSFLNKDVGGGGSVAAGRLPDEIVGFQPKLNYSYPQWKARDTANQLSDDAPAGPLNIALANNARAYGPAAVAAATSLYGYDKSVAVAHHTSAIGTVRATGVSIEQERSVGRLATLIVGRYAAGHNVLRPEATVEIATGESSLS